MTINKAEINAMVASANQAFEASKVAGLYALTEHGGYQAALATNAAAHKAYSGIKGLTQGYLDKMLKDKSTAQTWYDFLVPKRDLALAKIASLEETRGYLLKDLAEHVQVKPKVAPATRQSLYRTVVAASHNGSLPAAAAKAVDQAMPEVTANQPVPVPSLGIWPKILAGGAAVVGLIWAMGRR